MLSAFTLAAAMVLFWVVYVAMRAGAGPGLGSVVRVGVVATSIGMTGTLVFGIWLAIALEAYRPWDGWVIAALVLWAVAGGTGDKAAKASRQPGGAGRALVLHAVTTLLVVLILADMIWKPGA